MFRYSYSIIPLLILLSSCSHIITQELVDEYKEEKNSENLRELQEKLSEKEDLGWQDLHNLGYVSYLLWQLWEWDIPWLIESLEYFRQSYTLWEDERTKYNIEILEELLDELLRSDEQDNEQEQSRDSQDWDETLEDKWGESDDTWSQERSEEDSWDEDESWENPWENWEDISRENWDDAHWNNHWESGDTQPQSEQIFQELWFESEEELLGELERYTGEILQRQERNLQELRREWDSTRDIFEEFFGWWGRFFRGLPQQWEKDW